MTLTFVAFLFSVGLIWWFLLSFLRELTRPEVPEALRHQLERKRGERELTA
ncbi:MAG TPA: hypothetical protein VEG32_03885 [Clostridia bacterium]|nr:hypothetical protein [Clostridia bacterium]